MVETGKIRHCRGLREPLIRQKSEVGTVSDKNPAVVAAVEKMEQKLRPHKYLFYGDECKDMECKPVAQFPGVTNLLELFAVLEQCWSKESSLTCIVSR